MSDQSKQWQEIASQGIATERTLRIRIEQLEAALREAGDIYREATFLARTRVEALETALRKVIDNVETGSYESAGQAIDEARAILY